MPYSNRKIAALLNADATIVSDTIITQLLTDSRKIVFPAASLFFALSGNRRDGHQFIAEVYERGVRNFVVQKTFDPTAYPDASFLKVDHVLQSLQQLVAYHRKNFSIPVIGITGSNGKTIVKEWLYQLMQQEQTIIRSPRSYNSQLGVPLSVWQINTQHTMGIFEAGISTSGEMQALEKIIQPTIGVLTGFGEAHNEGFDSELGKWQEKLKLFVHCNTLIYSADTAFSEPVLQNVQLFSWSRKKNTADLYVKNEIRTGSQTQLTIVYKEHEYSIYVPFLDAASVDNALTCYAVLLIMGYDHVTIAGRLLRLLPVEMRLQLIRGVNNCSILNDSYSNDINSLGIALDHLKQQSGNTHTTVILSDILQSGLSEDALYLQVANQLKERNIHKLIGIGDQISRHQDLFTEVPQSIFFSSTEQFLQQTTLHHFRDEFILLKGARIFAFERIGKWLEQKVHQTVLEINLSALAHNLKEYQKHLLPSTKLMAMVKAYSYGSGSAEIARTLQFCKVDYLAVAYADEGVDLRKAGISLPIMVMNTDEAGFDALIDYNLEPEIYSFHIYNALNQYLLEQGVADFPVHIKLNTGMNRLGFEPAEIKALALQLKQKQSMVVKSVFSHLAASENPHFDDFTRQQADLFITAANLLEETLDYPIIRHIANSAGIFRHPDLQYDMVRLGIGLYGVDSARESILSLEPVASLKSTIAQIRKVKAGDTVGYNRNGKITRDSLIAVVRIGYADGFNRKLGNGVGAMLVNGLPAKVVGNVCMDMTMIDITAIENVKEGDIVEIFGAHLPVQQVADWSGTIPYEVMTSISQRVKRVYLEE